MRVGYRVYCPHQDFNRNLQSLTYIQNLNHPISIVNPLVSLLTLFLNPQVVTVVEKGLFGVRAGTYFQGRENSLEGSVSMRNAFGYAEQIEATIQRSREISNTFSLGLAVPRPSLRARIFQSNSNWQDLSSYIERLRGCQVSTDAGNHGIDYQLAWRELRVSGKYSYLFLLYLTSGSLITWLRHNRFSRCLAGTDCKLQCGETCVLQNFSRKLLEKKSYCPFNAAAQYTSILYLDLSTRRFSINWAQR